MTRPTVGWLPFLVGFGLLYAALMGTSAVDATGRVGLWILAVVLLSAITVERLLFGTPLAGVRRLLGRGRPARRALLVAGAVSAVVLLVFPLSAAVSGVSVQLRPDWIWLLVGIFAFHGLAEELVWRGYAFRRLREGRTFGSAMAVTMPLIAATHLPIAFTHGPVVGRRCRHVHPVRLPLRDGRPHDLGAGAGAHRDRQLQARGDPGGRARHVPAAAHRGQPAGPAGRARGAAPAAAPGHHHPPGPCAVLVKIGDSDGTHHRRDPR